MSSYTLFWCPICQNHYSAPCNGRFLMSHWAIFKVPFGHFFMAHWTIFDVPLGHFDVPFSHFWCTFGPFLMSHWAIFYVPLDHFLCSIGPFIMSHWARQPIYRILLCLVDLVIGIAAGLSDIRNRTITFWHS